jgi:hypothetical protein
MDQYSVFSFSITTPCIFQGPLFPLVIFFILHHSTRLDRVDLNWFSESIAPYNPPINLKGWFEGIKLGLTVGLSIQREFEQRNIENQADNDAVSQWPQVIIYTTPSLRCLQSSTAISIGIALRASHHHSRRRDLYPKGSFL